MKVVVAGGTGFIGKALCRAFSEAGDEVVALTRHPEGGSGRLVSSWKGVRAMGWSASPGRREPWWDEVDGADAVVNLAGEPVLAGLRWTDEHKKRVLSSRLEATGAVHDAIAAASARPRVCVNASAVGYYGLRDQTPLDESAAPGDDFLASVVRRWEEAARAIEALGVRLVLPRIGVVLGEKGGALEKMVLPFKLGAGGPLGSGKQWMPWVHLDDVTGFIRFAIAHEQVSGPVNVVAPGGADNRAFSKALGRVLHRPAVLPAPAFALRLVLGEAAAMVLGGQHPSAQKAIAEGYSFEWPELEPALRDVLRE